jgi:hypothetical protein
MVETPLFANRKGVGGKILGYVPNGAIVMSLDREHKSSYYSYAAHWVIYDEVVGWIAGWLHTLPADEEG